MEIVASGCFGGWKTADEDFVYLDAVRRIETVDDVPVDRRSCFLGGEIGFNFRRTTLFSGEVVEEDVG